MYGTLHGFRKLKKKLFFFSGRKFSMVEDMDSMIEFVNFRRPQGIKSKITLEKEKKILDLYKNSKQSMDEIAIEVGLSRNTLYKFIKKKKTEFSNIVKQNQPVDQNQTVDQ
jgi:response regulator of citrate/malate metabolism